LFGHIDYHEKIQKPYHQDSCTNRWRLNASSGALRFNGSTAYDGDDTQESKNVAERLQPTEIWILVQLYTPGILLVF
jgi:hypothetical protein